MMATTIFVRFQLTEWPVTTCTTREVAARPRANRPALTTRSMTNARNRDTEPAYCPCALTQPAACVRALMTAPGHLAGRLAPAVQDACAGAGVPPRSEERSVGKEC